jgi:hypothetical protein
MKAILVVGALLLAGGGAWLFLAHRGPDHHGQAFRGLGAVEIASLVEKPTDYLKKDVRIEGTLAKQCPSTGCWFYLREPGGKEIKVEMGDTTPELPARVGKKATVEGQLIRYGEEYQFIGNAVEFHK